jgi:FkbM family methyltransferase
MLLSRWRYYLSSIPTLLLGVRNWPKMLAAFLGLPVSRPFVVELRNGYHFRVRTRMDIWIIKEICLDHQYENASVEIEDGWTVIDIGAGLGDFAVHAAKGRPRSRIYAYEPFRESFALLLENLRLNQIQNVKAFPCAVCAQAGPTDFHISSEAVAHTTVVPRSEIQRDCIQVPSATLDQLLDELQLSRCDYLKMDCEGAEYEILFNTSARTLQRIKHLCIEYHDGVTGFSHHDLVRFFVEHGFQVQLTPCPAYRHLGLLYALNPSEITGPGSLHGDD